MTHRLRRCHISVPGSNEKMLLKSTKLDVDVVIIDLEDAVAPLEKENARNLVAQLLKEETWRAADSFSPNKRAIQRALLPRYSASHGS